MKKIRLVAVVIVALAVLYTGASGLVGIRAQSVIEAALARANQRFVQKEGAQAPQVAHARIAAYERGVFTSRVRYVIGPIRLDKDRRGELEFEDVLHHGPFPWQLLRQGDFSPLLAYSETRLLPTAFSQPWFDVAQGEPVQVRTQIGFTQEGTSRWQIAPVAFDDTRGVLRFSGGTLTVEFAERFTQSDVTGHFAGLSYTHAARQFQMHDIAMSGQARAYDGVVQSEGEVRAASIAFNAPGLEDTKLEDFTLSAVTEQYVDGDAGALADTTVRYRVGKLTALQTDWGAFDLALGAKRIDVGVLMALAQALENADMDSDAIEDTLFDTLDTHLQSLLAAQPVVFMDPLRWENEKGESRLTLRVGLADAERGEYSVVLLEDYGLPYIHDATLSVSVSRAMAVRTMMLIMAGSRGASSRVGDAVATMLYDQYTAGLEEAGVVERDGENNIKVQFSYCGEDEAVELNGRQMSLAEFAVLIMRAL